MRRLRATEGLRDMVEETTVRTSDLILPIFFDETLDEIRTTPSMPGVVTYPLKDFENIASEITESGVRNVIVFGVPSEKGPYGKQAYSANGVVQRAIRGLKDCSDLTVIADLCLCEYTDHGHCGVLHDGHVENDETLELYAETAISQADAGADMIAPSGMMDGQVTAIRDALDRSGHSMTPIMAYSAKYCSAFYGPFRDVACSCLGRGNRKEYQMQCGNRREAIREAMLDVEEGADIIMVKPAMSYLDIIRDLRERTEVPIAAYQVSGEYAMIKAAATNGWVNGTAIMKESIQSIKRAGADIVITYFAKEMAELLR